MHSNDNFGASNLWSRPWQPVTIALVDGFIFSSPFALVDLIKNVHESSVVVVSGTDAALPAVAAVIGPGAKFTTAVCAIRKIFNARDEQPRTCPPGESLADVGVTLDADTNAAISVCDVVLGRRQAQQSNLELHISHIVESVPWIKTVSQIKQTSGVSEVCPPSQ